jgi:DNA helicase II / ATP-dependent DNA helicase PcrA
MDLSSLNDKQLEAVTAPLGPVLVLAGAGSGKTRVLTYRVAYLIEQNLMAPENILALTFTNKAAKEMQGRVLKLLDPTKAAAAPTLGTFHSVNARLLRKEIMRLGYGPGFIILDSDDQLKILREIVDDMGLSKKFPPTLFRAYISSAKNLLQTPEELNLGLDGPMQELVYKAYVDYQNFLFKQNSVDFDDLLMLPIKIFQIAPEVLQKYQQLFQYILVDEYQDTNQAQYAFLYMLASHRNLFVVGDDAQSIYGFRGSNIRNILNFENDYPEAQVIKLEQNYRSTKNILAVAQKVIELNKEQKPKTLWTENPDGKKIIIEEAVDGRAEALFVARQIVRLSTGQSEEVDYEPEEESQSFSILDQFLKKQSSVKGGFSAGAFGIPQLPKVHDSLNQFAILYRTHAQSRELEEVLIQAGIPYQIVGGVKFYERKEIKDVLAYLRLTLNFRDLVSLKRVINEPARGIGPKSYSIIKEFVLGWNTQPDNDTLTALTRFRHDLQYITLPPKQKQGVEQFFGLIHQLATIDDKATLTDILRTVIKLTKIEDWLRDGTETGEARVENVRELFNVTIKYNHLPWREGLSQFLEEVALVTEIDNLEDEKDAVTLMTLHSAKGLEFDTVFFVGLEEGLLPHSQSLLDPKELSEEIRLAYVGLTRARRQLFLLYARSRRVFGNIQANLPSRILRVLPPEAVNSRVSGVNMWDNDSEVSYEPVDF